MSSNGYELGTADTLEEVMDRRTDDFHNLKIEQLLTQWKHKIAAVPQSADGGGTETAISSKWWTFTSGVNRVGPSAQVPPGENIRTDQSGDYIVGVPALAGGAARVEGTPVQNAGDDWWTGYTNRLIQPAGDRDGAGIGYSYFDAGEGDLGGADAGGDQEYVWFYSGVSGVSNLRVPRDQWNGELAQKIADGDFDDEDLSKGNLFNRGGFVRIDHTFYDEGTAKVNYGIKKNDGSLEVITLHELNVVGDEMWQRSDLSWQMETTAGAGNLTGYIAAAHYQAGESKDFNRFSGEGRDGSVFGAGVTITSGTPIPLISIRKRNGWESVNLTPLDYSVSMDNSFYVFVGVDATLTGANFTEPNLSFANLAREDSEYAALSDNEATAVDNLADVEVLEFVPPVWESGDVSCYGYGRGSGGRRGRDYHAGCDPHRGDSSGRSESVVGV